MPKKSTTNENPNKKINDKKAPKKKRNNIKQHNVEEFSDEIGVAMISPGSAIKAVENKKDNN